ncbi:hypothetical protein SAMN05660236_4888 [Ohtaekwangia koreensis]|uniref:Uncharacterized protein n=1 Tax=Ohtaekwangia koreensis TaxID=688867 RepID=A0A1T5MBV9_9BACT|nr:hypothetical protein SAMN05660236_4888 [Ohtaekwangia koreensis]
MPGVGLANKHPLKVPILVNRYHYILYKSLIKNLRHQFYTDTYYLVLGRFVN